MKKKLIEVTTRELFSSNGKKINKSMEKIIEVFPLAYDHSKLTPSKLVKYIWQKLNENNMNNAERGYCFEAIIMLVLLRNNINPFFYQVSLNFVPNVKFDLVLFNQDKNPIVISLKTSSRERYKQVELEALLCKQVHRFLKTYLVMIEADDVGYVKQKIESREITFIDNCFCALDEEFDDFINSLSKSDYIEPGDISIISSGKKF